MNGGEFPGFFALLHILPDKEIQNQKPRYAKGTDEKWQATKHALSAKGPRKEQQSKTNKKNKLL